MNRSPHSEPFLPKVSIRWLIGLVTVSAVCMGVVHQAVTTGGIVSVLVSVSLAAVLLPVLVYIGTFTLASCFAMVGSAVAGAEQTQTVHVPTAVMPGRNDSPIKTADDTAS